MLGSRGDLSEKEEVVGLVALQPHSLLRVLQALGESAGIEKDLRESRDSERLSRILRRREHEVFGGRSKQPGPHLGERHKTQRPGMFGRRSQDGGDGVARFGIAAELDVGPGQAARRARRGRSLGSRAIEELDGALVVARLHGVVGHAHESLGANCVRALRRSSAGRTRYRHRQGDGECDDPDAAARQRSSDSEVFDADWATCEQRARCTVLSGLLYSGARRSNRDC